MENGRVFEIEELQSPKWVRFPVTRVRRFSGDDFAIQLLRDKISKMLSKQILELSQVLILATGFRKRIVAFPD